MFKKILAVDDSDIVLNLHQMTFRRHPNVDLLTARNGIEAMKKLKENPDIELVLLDINMPRVDGIEVLRQIKQDEKHNRIPVIMLTTTDDPREINRAYELGCSVYVTKPVAYEAFVEAVSRLGLFLQVVRVPPEAGVLDIGTPTTTTQRV